MSSHIVGASVTTEVGSRDNVSLGVRAAAGSCSTVACWPLLKLGNSTASWWTVGVSMLNYRNRAIFAPAFLRKNGSQPSYSTSFSNAISVPGRRHTATFGSPIAAKPRVMVLLKMTVSQAGHRLPPCFWSAAVFFPRVEPTKKGSATSSRTRSSATSIVPLAT